jgi:uncharacterized membrane protein
MVLTLGLKACKGLALRRIRREVVDHRTAIVDTLRETPVLGVGLWKRVAVAAIHVLGTHLGLLIKKLRCGYRVGRTS